MFRVHGSYGLKPGKEFWRFDAKTQDILRTYLNLRYRLLPYLYSVAWQVTSGGSTFMRPLVMDFPNDPKVLDIGNQYLFGPSIMVTPVTTAGATSRQSICRLRAHPGITSGPAKPLPAGQRIEAACSRSKLCLCSCVPAQSFPWGRSFSIPAKNRPIRSNCASIEARMATSRSTKMKATPTTMKRGNTPPFRSPGTSRHIRSKSGPAAAVSPGW